MSKIIKAIKNNYLLLIAVISVVLGLTLTTGNALKIYAETINAGVLKIEYPGSGALFNETNIYPGFEITKTVTVTNQGTLPHSFSIAVDNTLGPLADVLVIEPSVLGTPVWTKTVSEIKKNPDSDVIISSISPGGVVDVDMRAYLPESVGNEYMGTSTFSFGFVMGNESTDQPEPEDENQTFSYGNSDASTAVSTRSSVAETGGDDSNEPEEEKEGAVLLEDDKGAALGAETEELPICYWWWVLLIIYAIFLIIYGYLFCERNNIIVWFWPIFIAIALYLIHWILHDYYQPSDMCPYFIWFQLAGLALYGGGVYIRRSQMPEEEK